MSVATSPNHWLSDCLCDLMSSPHVSMPSQGGMHLGPGPVDVFTTRFDQYFDPNARGTICGRPVDREGLRAALLALQKRWNTEALKVSDEAHLNGVPLGHNLLNIEVEWTPRGSTVPEVVMAEATVGEQQDRGLRIRFLRMEGNSALFRS